MNVEYAYILKSFLPEIMLVAVGLLVLFVDLLLPKRDTRHALTLVAALGCLLAAGLAAQQWVASAQIRTDKNGQMSVVQAPGFVTEQITVLADHIVNASSDPSQMAEMHGSGRPEMVAGQWMQAIQMQGGKTPEITNAQAHQLVSILNIAEMGAKDRAGLTLKHPGFAAWWLFANDRFAAAFKVIFSLAAFLVLLLMTRFPLPRYRAEFSGLLLFAAVGLMVMVNSLDLVVLFLGLELSAVCLYALAAWQKDDPRSAEAGIKYLLLGSLASAVFIYGASLLFVKYGTTNLNVLSVNFGLQNMLAQGHLLVEPLVMIGLLMLLVGFAFKVAAAPFHMWAPDVYQGAPTPMVAFLSTASKAAGFAVLLRALSVGFIHLSPQWTLLIGIVAALSMLVGNLVAVHQNNVKRLLAYSGIAQSGYLLIAVMALGLSAMKLLQGQGQGTSDPIAGVKAVVFYLFLYMITNIGAFAITGIVGREAGHEEMTAFAGLRARAPLLAFAMLVLLLALGGIPLLSGFVGKWFIFLSGVREGQYLLVLLGAALSVVSIYYYLLVAKQMYIKPAEEGAKPIRVGAVAGIGLLIIVLATVIIGVYPAPFLDLAQTTALSLFGQ